MKNIFALTAVISLVSTASFAQANKPANAPIPGATVHHADGRITQAVAPKQKVIAGGVVHHSDGSVTEGSTEHNNVIKPATKK